ncbi:MAG: ATP synthase F1 subunit gamma [Flavobacteriales bacterium]|nr:ATP synthase F1 subunit gamma [Bacteroidota bacterium]MCB9240263.1 ATP synthase F1 subunit gamma [Flavobacteriales bacterium]
MANLKEVRTRISTTQSTQQITKAMKLVSATKLRKAQMGITKMRPYAEKLNTILVNLADSAKDDMQLRTYFQYREPKKALVVVISSDRGLCGAFNSNIIKATRRLLQDKYKAEGTDADLMFIGKKAYDIFKKTDYTCITDKMGHFADMDADSTFDLAQDIIDRFKSGKYDEVRIVYNQFKNAATQFVQVEKMLPVEIERFESSDQGTVADYIFEPGKAEILYDLVPRAIKTQLFKACLDSQASEHGARMVAMDKATENAGELIEKLKLKYNQARQAAITGEILEIVGGAAALEG